MTRPGQTKPVKKRYQGYSLFRSAFISNLQTLLNTIKRWSWAFQKHELDHLIDALNELEDFITKADEGLEIELAEGDYDNLIK